MTTSEPGTPLRLETASFVLRSTSPSDPTDRYVEWYRDAELMENLNRPAREYSREEVIRYIERFDNKTSYHLGVFTKESGLHIGFYTVFVDPRDRVAQTHVVFGDRDYWGKKAVLETRAAIIDFLFDRLGMERIFGTPNERNFPAIYNYRAQGFKCEGVLRKHVVRASGERVDQYVFGLLREEWRARKGKRNASHPDTQAASHGDPDPLGQGEHGGGR